MGHLCVVVGESDGGKRTSGKNSDPHETVAQVGPEKRGHDDRDDDQQSPHGGLAAFFLWAFGPSSRMNCPIWKSRRRPITSGPTIRAVKRAVRLANAVRKVT